MRKESIQILPLIKREMKRKRISPAELSRGLKVNQSSISGMLNRPTLQVQKLIELSDLLEYNFFREIAVKLPYTEPNLNDQTETESLKARIKELEMEVGILRQTLKDVVNR